MYENCQVILTDINNLLKFKLKNNEDKVSTVKSVKIQNSKENLQLSENEFIVAPVSFISDANRIQRKISKIPVVSIEKLSVEVVEKSRKIPPKFTEKLPKDSLKVPIVCIEKLREKQKIARISVQNEQIETLKVPIIEIEKLYWCSRCQRNFKSTRALQDHQNDHKNEEQDFEEPGEIGSEMDFFESTKNFESTQCRKMFSAERFFAQKEEEEKSEEEEEDIEIDVVGYLDKNKDLDFSQNQNQNQRFDLNDSLHFPSETEDLIEPNEISTSQEESFPRNRMEEPLINENTKSLREEKLSKSPQNFVKDPLIFQSEDEETEITCNFPREEKFADSPQNQENILEDPLCQYENGDFEETEFLKSSQEEKLSPRNRRNFFKDPLHLLENDDIQETEIAKSPREKKLLPLNRRIIFKDPLHFLDEDEEIPEPESPREKNSRNRRIVFKDPLLCLDENEDIQEQESPQETNLRKSSRIRKTVLKEPLRFFDEDEDERIVITKTPRGRKRKSPQNPKSVLKDPPISENKNEFNKMKIFPKYKNSSELQYQNENEDTINTLSKLHPDNSKRDLSLNGKISETVKPVNNSLHTCDICLKQFERKDSLQVHVAKHLDEKRYNCSYCGKKFIEPSILKIHMAFHTNNRPFDLSKKKKKTHYRNFVNPAGNIETKMDKPLKCKICGMSVSTIAILKSHMLGHLGVKPFECHICHLRLATNSSLRSHLTIHENKKPFSCEICSKKFRKLCYLKFHQRIHMVKRPYECQICNRTFSRRLDVKSHMYYHTGRKPYQCSYCGADFLQNKLLQHHMLVHVEERRKNNQGNLDNRIQKSRVEQRVRKSTKKVDLKMKQNLQRKSNFYSQRESVTESNENIDVNYQDILSEVEVLEVNTNSRKSTESNGNDFGTSCQEILLNEEEEEEVLEVNTDFRKSTESNRNDFGTSCQEILPNEEEVEILEVNTNFQKSNFESGTKPNEIDLNISYQEAPRKKLKTNSETKNLEKSNFYSQDKPETESNKNIDFDIVILSETEVPEISTDLEKSNFHSQTEANESYQEILQNEISEVNTNLQKSNFHSENEANEDDCEIIFQNISPMTEVPEVNADLQKDDGVKAAIKKKKIINSKINNKKRMKKVKNSEMGPIKRKKTVNTNNEAYECEICRKVIKYKNNFKFHMSLHSNERNFECDMCKKKFTSYEQMKRHIRRHIQVMTGRDKMHSCSICGKKFARPIYLNRHKVIHCRPGDNFVIKFKCGFCVLTFESKYLQLRHERKFHKSATKRELGSEMQNKENGDLEFDEKDIKMKFV